MDTVEATLTPREIVYKPNLEKYRALLREHPLGTRNGNPDDLLDDMPAIVMNGLEGDLYDGDRRIGHFTFRGEPC
jgi:hypothetical protein